MQNDFNAEEVKEISKQAIQLIIRQYLTGVNFIRSKMELPETAVIIHYLHDSEKQINFVLEELKKFGSYDSIILPRHSQYYFHPKYAKKPRFIEEYQNAQFVDTELNKVTIEDVVKNPENKVVVNDEIDLIIPLSSGDIAPLVAHIQKADLEGPDHWLHPAIIVRGNTQFPAAPGFVKKDYASLRRTCAEFYSVVSGDIRKERLMKRLETICGELKGSAQAQLTQDSVLWFSGQINPELDSYINEILREQDLPG